MTTNTQMAKLVMMLGALFESQREEWKRDLPPAVFEQRRHDFVFHMLDWKDDLERLALFFSNPDCLDEEAASSFLIGFIYHVLPHLNAAGMLLLDEIKDPFAASKVARC